MKKVLAVICVSIMCLPMSAQLVVDSLGKVTIKAHETVKFGLQVNGSIYADYGGIQ